jgi:hypothetical protein
MISSKEISDIAIYYFFPIIRVQFFPVQNYFITFFKRYDN